MDLTRIPSRGSGTGRPSSSAKVRRHSSGWFRITAKPTRSSASSMRAFSSWSPPSSDQRTQQPTSPRRTPHIRAGFVSRTPRLSGSSSHPVCQTSRISSSVSASCIRRIGRVRELTSMALLALRDPRPCASTRSLRPAFRIRSGLTRRRSVVGCRAHSVGERLPGGGFLARGDAFVQPRVEPDWRNTVARKSLV